MQHWPLWKLKGTWQNRKWLFSGFLTGLEISPPVAATRQPYIDHFISCDGRGFFGGRCVSSTGNVEVKEQDGISFKTPRSLSSVTLLSLSRYKSFPVVIEHKSFQPLGTFCTLFTRWINIHFKVNMEIGPIYFLNTHSWFSTACFSKEEKYIYLHYPSLKLALQPIWRSFLADATYASSLKNDEPFRVLWAFLFRTWTDYYDVELQISAQRRKK